MSVEDILDSTKLCYDGDFNDQFKNLLQTVRLSRTQVENLSFLLDDLQGELRRIWPECMINAFGSIVMGLGIKTSDIDIHVETHTSQLPRDSVMEARNVLKRCPQLFRNIFAITAAKVPIVKLFHIPTQCNSDISFSGPAGVRNSAILTYLLRSDDRALNLAILIKYWSKVHNFTGTNLMPNYALTLLVVFYLQHKGMLPSILTLQKGITRDMVNGWNTAFNDRGGRQKPSGCNATFYELLGGFFKYYSTFDYTEDVVTPYTGYRLKRKAFSCVRNIPSDYELYKHNITSRLCKPLRLNTFMCVQDTFEHNRNCTVAVYPRLAVKIVAHFKYAADLYDKVDSDNYLRMLLSEDPNDEPRIPHKPESNNWKKVMNNKQLFKKSIKDRFKAGLLTVDSFPKRKNNPSVPVKGNQRQ